MKKTNWDKLGWLVAAGLAGIMLGGGFQGGSVKLGVVDVAKVIEQSDMGKKNQDDFAAMKSAREGVLQFIDNYRVLTIEQAQKIRDLSLKQAPTTAEKAELERVKAEVVASDKKAKELAQKPNLTPEERTLMEEYAKRSQTMEETAQQWYRAFTNEMQSWADKQKQVSLDKARESVQDIGKRDGYTVVYEAGLAPFGANDITDAALKQMNTKKP